MAERSEKKIYIINVIEKRSDDGRMILYIYKVTILTAEPSVGCSWHFIGQNNSWIFKYIGSVRDDLLWDDVRSNIRCDFNYIVDHSSQNYISTSHVDICDSHLEIICDNRKHERIWVWQPNSAYGFDLFSFST